MPGEIVWKRRVHVRAKTLPVRASKVLPDITNENNHHKKTIVFRVYSIAAPMEVTLRLCRSTVWVELAVGFKILLKLRLSLIRSRNCVRALT